jgi:Zn-dependent protease with chaperone function
MRRVSPWVRVLFVVAAVSCVLRALRPGNGFDAHPAVERIEHTSPTIQRRADQLADEVGVDDVTVYRWETDVPNMFVLGGPSDSHVFATTAALEVLTEDEAVACVGHELAHSRHRHIAALTGMFLVGVAVLPVTYALAGGRRRPVVGAVAAVALESLYAVLAFGLTRNIERAADLTGGVDTGNGRTLARALIKIYTGGQVDCEPEAFEPPEHSLFDRLVASHPPVEVRAAYLTANESE